MILTFGAIVLVLGCLALGLWAVATAGDSAAHRRVEALRRRTSYRPPANARPRDFDQFGRPI